MMKDFKKHFHKIHYSKGKINFFLRCALGFCEFFYRKVINTKNFLYDKNILKEKKVNAYVVCVGNLTTGGVGKTPIVGVLANDYSKEKKVAVVSRGYGAVLSGKNPVVVKDGEGLKFDDGRLCGDEPFQIAKKTNENVVVIICSNRKKAADFAVENYGAEIIILDDGFSNRSIKKDKTIIAIDSKMRFGNGHLLPYGPLREPSGEIKRANEVIIVDKGDENLDEAIDWVRNKFIIPLKVSKMSPCKIYNIQTKALIKLKRQKAIAFCAIGQAEQFFDFAKKYYDIAHSVDFCDHHKYDKEDIKELIKLAKKEDTTTFITTQKDETKLKELIKDITGYSFNVLELDLELQEVN